MRAIYFITLTSLLILSSFSCVDKRTVPSSIVTAAPRYQIDAIHSNHSYDFDQPTHIYKLAKSLKEISSLAYDKKNNSLITCDDESGRFYELDPSNGEIIAKHKFSKRGDYEGITVIDNQVVVLKSNGNLFFYNRKTTLTKEIKTGLHSRNDTEGLAYNPSKKELLIACKGQPLNNNKNSKAIYRFDLGHNKLTTEPYIDLRDSILLTLVPKNNDNKQNKKLRQRASNFSPSAIALHPINKTYYLLSAKGSTLLVCNINRTPVQLVFLDSKLIPQPEGITFDKDNNLYLATEGQGSSGKIVRYDIL